jgi:membrane associated rhomboid family serine protease
MGEMRYVIIAVLAALYFFVPVPEILLSGSGILPAAIHHFFHANIFHLAANSLCIWMLYKPGRYKAGRDILLPYAIATLSYFFATTPVIGFSNILFAVSGLRTPSLKHQWWRSRNAAMFFGFMLLTLFMPRVSAVTHIVSFTAGALIGSAKRFIRRTAYDARRAKGCQ